MSKRKQTSMEKENDMYLLGSIYQGSRYEGVLGEYFSHFSMETYVVGTH